MASVIAPLEISVPDTDDEMTWGGELLPSDAALWLEAMTCPDVTFVSILDDVLTPRSAEQLRHNMATGHLAVRDVEAACKQAIEQATGRPWWVVLNILAVTEASWDTIGGEMAARGIFPNDISIGAWLDAAWWIIRYRAMKNSEASHDQIVSAVEAMPTSEMTDETMTMSFDEYMQAASTLPAPVNS